MLIHGARRRIACVRVCNCVRLCVTLDLTVSVSVSVCTQVEGNCVTLQMVVGSLSLRELRIDGRAFQTEGQLLQLGAGPGEAATATACALS